MPIHALIFDLDGVIADTVRAHEAGWLLVAEKLGVTLTTQMQESFRGRRRADILHTMTGRVFSAAEIDAIMPTKIRHYDDFLTHMTPAHILPGVETLLSRARSRGLALAIASSSYNARAVLEKTGLTAQFDAIADGYTVARAKPNADIFVWAAGALRISPMSCAVFEDAEAGVTAARDAGAYVVGVGTPSIVGHAHMVVPDLVDFDLDALLLT